MNNKDQETYISTNDITENDWICPMCGSQRTVQGSETKFLSLDKGIHMYDYKLKCSLCKWGFTSNSPEPQETLHIYKKALYHAIDDHRDRISKIKKELSDPKFDFIRVW